VLDQEKQYLKLDIQPAVAKSVKDDRLQFWTKTLSRKIKSLQGLK
jgi:hypothetical protein